MDRRQGKFYFTSNNVDVERSGVIFFAFRGLRLNKGDEAV